MPPRDSVLSTGIDGLDAIFGGLPRNRVSIITGGPGSGKTLFALQALAHNATNGHPGVLVTFEEPPAQVVNDASGFNWNLEAFIDEKIHCVDAQLPAAVLQEGSFDVEGLLARLGAFLDTQEPTLVVFDGLDMLLDLLGDATQIRREVLRIRTWMKKNELTGIITAKTYAGGALAAPYDFLRFAADCEIELYHRLSSQVGSRSVRVAKCRGVAHSSSEFPFVFAPSGIHVASRPNITIEHPVSNERVSSGIDQLDDMLGGGYFRGSSILVSGAPGTAKTTLAASVAAATCSGGERCLYVSFDEAGAQIVRNLQSIDIQLEPYVEDGTLHFLTRRARAAPPEVHVADILRTAEETNPSIIVIDPVSALKHASDSRVAEGVVVQLIDGAKERGTTIFSTTLLDTTDPTVESTPLNLSTVADTWMHLSYVTHAGERNRGITVVKSRGMRHSNQVRELILSDSGVRLAEVYTSAGEVLMGTMRWAKEEEERSELERERRQLRERQREAEGALKQLDTQMDALDEERERLTHLIEAARGEEEQLEETRATQSRRRREQRLRDPDLERSDE